MLVAIFFLPLFFATLLAFPQSSDLSEKTFKNCKTQEGASDEDLKFLQDGKIPELRIEKCLSACLMESLGVVKI